MKLSSYELRKTCEQPEDMLPTGSLTESQRLPSSPSLFEPPSHAINPRPPVPLLHPPLVPYEQSRDVIKKFSMRIVEIDSLGEGACGEVFKVELKDAPGVQYALKRSAGTMEYEGNFKFSVREAAHLVRLSHPNIINIVGVDIDVRSSYILLPLYASDFAALLEKKKLSSRQILKYAYDVVVSVAYLHSRNMMHLDIKPQNFLYNEKDDTLVLCDFNSAASGIRGGTLTDEDLVTVWYRPPELFFYKDMLILYNEKVDVWSVGLLIIEMGGKGRIIQPRSKEEFMQQATLALGPIDPALWPRVQDLKRADLPANPQILQQKYKEALNNDELYNLALSMLKYNSKERISMYTAMKNSVFDSVRDHSRECECMVCLDRLYSRRLGRPDSAFEGSSITHTMIDTLWGEIILLSIDSEASLQTIYLTRHLLDECASPDLNPSDLPLYGATCFALASLAVDKKPTSLTDTVLLFTEIAKIHKKVFLDEIKYSEDDEEDTSARLTEDDLEEKIAKLANSISCDLLFVTTVDFIDQYVWSAYEDYFPVGISRLAHIVGLLYLYSSEYYRWEAYEIAVCAIYYTTQGLNLPFLLDNLMECSRIRQPFLEGLNLDPIRVLLRQPGVPNHTVDVLLSIHSETVCLSE